MFIKPKNSIIAGYPYRCGCRLRKWEVKQIYAGLMEGMELHTKKLLKAVSEGKFGDEWQQMLLEHPDGSVNCMYDLYLCDKCGNWENEEIMDFYLPKNITKWKDVNNYLKEPSYSLFRKFTHTCSKCGSSMRLEHLLDYGENLNGRHVYDVGKRNKKKLYDLHLKCPKCEKEIVVIEYVRIKPDMQGVDFIDYKPK